MNKKDRSKVKPVIELGEKYLDPRADNYFGFEKDYMTKEGWYVLVQTWHVYLHFEGAAPDDWALRQFRTAVKSKEELSDAAIQNFADISERKLAEHMAGGVYTADVDQETGEPLVKKFDGWKIKDFRQA